MNKRMTGLVLAVSGCAILAAFHNIVKPRLAEAVAAGGNVQRDVLYGPTPYEVIQEMFKIGSVTKDDVVYDLGCGDGRIVIEAARTIGARCVGIDIDPRRISECMANAGKARVDGLVQFRQCDLFTADISSATVVTIFLNKKTNARLRPKLLKELKPGTRVISHKYDMGDWKPDRRSMVSGRAVYFWVVPADVNGSWEWILPDGRGHHQYILHLKQKFQEVEGYLSVGQSRIPLKNVRLNGEDLQFIMEDTVDGKKMVMKFEGRINNGSIEGVVRSGSTSTIADNAQHGQARIVRLTSGE